MSEHKGTPWYAAISYLPSSSYCSGLLFTYPQGSFHWAWPMRSTVTMIDYDTLL